MILNYFDLGDVFYNSCKKSYLNKLQTIQDNALRCIFTDSKDLNTNTMHEQAGLLRLGERRTLNQCAITHKHEIAQFSYDHNRNPSLRSSTKISLIVPRPHNRCFEKSFIYTCIKKWNGLPENLKSIPNVEVKSFKTRVRKEMDLNNINFPE